MSTPDLVLNTKVQITPTEKDIFFKKLTTFLELKL